MKVAIVHEMLVKLWGAEKVVEVFMGMFPEADIFTLIYDEKKTGSVFPKEKIHPSYKKLSSQKLYNIFWKQRLCLPFMKRSVEQLHLSEYNLVIVSSSWFAHGVITKPETKTVVYSHSPMRYIWDWTNEYKKDIGWESGIKGFILNRLFLHLRQWDYIASKRSDILIANSKNCQSRITKYYRKESSVLYPPVDTKRFAKTIDNKKEVSFENYYIIISALSEFKNISVAISGFNQLPDQNLVVIGDGDYKTKLEWEMTGKNIIFTWPKYWNDLVSLVQNSRGLIFPWEEDFGIVPIEVMAAGKPVFAFNRWWLRETVISWVTWDFFDHHDGTDFVEKFTKFHADNTNKKYSKKSCQEQAKNFDTEIFVKQFQEVLKSKDNNTIV